MLIASVTLVVFGMSSAQLVRGRVICLYEH